jgi:hypothetical protein
VVATSAGGGSVETLDALTRMPAGVRTVALTNTADSAITQRCDAVVTLDAQLEVGGVACRSYQHTLVMLIALERHLTGADTSSLAAAVPTAADATERLIGTESDWLPEVSELLLGPSGTHLAAPAHRFCSAQQGALMLREGPPPGDDRRWRAGRRPSRRRRAHRGAGAQRRTSRAPPHPARSSTKHACAQWFPSALGVPTTSRRSSRRSPTTGR